MKISKRPFFLFFSCVKRDDYDSNKFIGLIDTKYTTKIIQEEQLQIDYGNSHSFSYLLSLFYKSFHSIEPCHEKYISTSILTIVAYLTERGRKCHIFSFSNRVIYYLDLFHSSIDFDYYYDPIAMTNSIKHFVNYNITEYLGTQLFSSLKIVIRFVSVEKNINLICKPKNCLAKNIIVSKRNGFISFTFNYKKVESLDIQIIRESVFYIWENVHHGKLKDYVANSSMDISFICHLGYNKIYFDFPSSFWTIMKKTNSKFKIYLNTDFHCKSRPV